MDLNGNFLPRGAVRLKQQVTRFCVVPKDRVKSVTSVYRYNADNSAIRLGPVEMEDPLPFFLLRLLLQEINVEGFENSVIGTKYRTSGVNQRSELVLSDLGIFGRWTSNVGPESYIDGPVCIAFRSWSTRSISFVGGARSLYLFKSMRAQFIFAAAAAAACDLKRFLAATGSNSLP